MSIKSNPFAYLDDGDIVVQCYQCRRWLRTRAMKRARNGFTALTFAYEKVGGYCYCYFCLSADHPINHGRATADDDVKPSWDNAIRAMEDMDPIEDN